MKKINSEIKSGFNHLMPMVILIGIILNVTPAMSMENSGDEIANLKAAFIYNFTKYITWPNTGQNKTFKIGVLGDSDITESLKQVAEKKSVNDKNIEIQIFESLPDLHACQILFISQSEEEQINEIITKLGKRPILTIGDTPQFCEQGIMINFFLQEGRIKFEMNPSNIEKSGLKVSSQLQKLARIVQ